MRLQIRPTYAVQILAALTIAAMAVTTAFLLWSLRGRELAHAQLETVAVAQMLIDQSEQQLQTADLVIQGVQERLSSSFGSQIPLDSELTHLLLATRLSGARQLRAIFLVDAQGTVINSSGSSYQNRVSVADRAYFKALAHRSFSSLYIDTPVRDRTDGQWTLHVARSLQGRGGEFRGVVVAAVDLAKIEQLFYQVKLDFLRPVAIYLEDGTLVASVPHRGNDLGSPALELSHIQVPGPGAGISSMVRATGDGEHQLFALGHLPGYPLLLSVTDVEELSLASWREIAIPILFSVLVLSLFTIAVAYALIQKLLRKERLNQELREANDRYLHTVESVKDAIVAVDEMSRILLFNPAAERMFGLLAADAVGQPLAILLPVGMSANHDLKLRQFMQTNDGPRAMAGNLEIHGRRSDGTLFPIESSISKTEIKGKIQLTAVLRDVTEQRRAKVELTALNQQLRNLYASQQNIREQEQARISRELHDDLGQQLTGLKLRLAWLGNRVKEGRIPEFESMDDMRGLLDTAISSVRRISSELRPVILDDLGFGDAVSWLTREFSKHSDLKIELDLSGQGFVQTSELTTAFFRIVQESLTNVVRHAKAHHVLVALNNEGDLLKLTIEDDGNGIQESSAGEGVGLVSMRERANAIGGNLRVVSSASGGTRIEVTIALSDLPAPPTMTDSCEEK